jgi:hypothetical protein
MTLTRPGPGPSSNTGARGARGSRRSSRTRDPGERRLRDVLSCVELNGVDDIVCTLRPLPTEPLSTRELASALECGMLLAQRTAHSAQRTAHGPTAYRLSTSLRRPASTGAHPYTGSPPRQTTPGRPFDRRWRIATPLRACCERTRGFRSSIGVRDANAPSRAKERRHGKPADARGRFEAGPRGWAAAAWFDRSDRPELSGMTWAVLGEGRVRSRAVRGD